MHSSLPDSRRKALFVHSYIDDLGLRPLEFRIYAHLCRRAGTNDQAFPGIRSIAEACCIDKTSVSPAIDGLVSRGLVRKSKGPRNANIYVLTEPDEWVEIPDSHTDSSPSGKSPSTVRKVRPVTVWKLHTQGNPLDNPKKKSEDETVSHMSMSEEAFRAESERQGLNGWGITASGYGPAQLLWNYYQKQGGFKSREHMRNAISKAVREKFTLGQRALSHL